MGTSTKRKSKTLIVMPAWNEKECIGEVLDKIKSGYPNLDILVVDDGSEDGTPVVAEEKGALVVSHNENLGYTAAIQTGRVYAQDNGYDFLIFIDADGQHRPLDIDVILDPLIKGDADQVRGSRELGKYIWKEPLHLKIPRWICSTLISFRLRKKITDVTSGFKGENRTVTEYFKKIYETSNKLHLSNTNDIEEHLLALKGRFRLMEVPIVMCRRGTGKTRCYTSRNLLKFPLDLIRTVFRNLL